MTKGSCFWEKCIAVKAQHATERKYKTCLSFLIVTLLCVKGNKGWAVPLKHAAQGDKAQRERECHEKVLGPRSVRVCQLLHVFPGHTRRKPVVLPPKVWQQVHISEDGQVRVMEKTLEQQQKQSRSTPLEGGLICYDMGSQGPADASCAQAKVLHAQHCLSLVTSIKKQYHPKYARPLKAFINELNTLLFTIHGV